MIASLSLASKALTKVVPSPSIQIALASRFLYPTLSTYITPTRAYAMPAQDDKNKLKFDFAPTEFKSQAEKLISEHTAVYDAVAAVPHAERTFQNTIAPLLDSDIDFGTAEACLTFPSAVAVDKAVRDASNEAEEVLDAFQINTSMREDIYLAFEKYNERRGELREKLGYEQERYIERRLREMRRNGLHLSQEVRDKVKELKNEISQKCIKFQQNLNEENTELFFTKDELDGMPDDFIDGLPKEGEKYKVTLKYPDLFPILKHCNVDETRRQMEHANSSKLMKENVPLLEEVLVLRQKLAETLGYKTHAAKVLEVRMAKSAETAIPFLEELKAKLEPYAHKELAKLLDMKRQRVGDKFDGKINSWDFQYYHTKLCQDEYNLDENASKVYFPLDKVTQGIFDIYQNMLGLRFDEVQGKTFWHDDVKLFEVHDSETNDYLGQFYLDLHPREGKYGHAAVFPLQPGGVRSDGKYQPPVVAMVANFTKPTAEKPSLLKHSEVVTYFHEMGHVLHGVCTKAEVTMFSGTRTERDFVEAPSQMLENWCYESESLRMMSGHYEDLSKPIPDDMIKNMVDAKNVNSGLFNLRQIFFGTFDLTVHTANGSVNTEELWGRLRKEITLIEHTPDTNPAAGFGHIMGGYDSGYYGYLWSQVFSADMFKVFKDNGNILDPKIGRHYRTHILEKGGTLDGDELIRNFLGREPTQEAFLDSIGLGK